MQINASPFYSFSLYFLPLPLIKHIHFCFLTHPIHSTDIKALWNSASLLILQDKKEGCWVQPNLKAQAVYLDCVLETLWVEGNQGTEVTNVSATRYLSEFHVGVSRFLAHCLGP